jgi:hypothetical protein
MTTATLGQTLELIKQLEIKMEELLKQKSSLFNRLKKVLHEETILKKRPMQNSTESLLIQSYPPHLIYPAQQLKFFTPQTPTNRITMYNKQINDGLASTLKRQRSPSPPSVSTSQFPPTSQQQIPIFQNPNSHLPSSVQSQTPTSHFSAYSPNKKPRPNTPQPSPVSFSSIIIPQATQQRVLTAPYSPSQQSAFSAYPKNSMNPHQSSGPSPNHTPQKQLMPNLISPVLPIPGPLQSQTPTQAFGAFAIAPRMPPPDTATLEQLKHMLTPAQWLKILESNPALHPQSGGIMSGFPLQRPPNQQQF